MTSTGTPWRTIVRDQLKLLSSEDEQLEYERNVPHVDITAELISGWFDDLYHPEAPEFRAAFTKAELEALERFNDLYRRRKEKLPESEGTVRCWLVSEAWREVMNAAATTLTKIAA